MSPRYPSRPLAGGTGKSTISYIVAYFFFKRGERDRSNTALLFLTIASQLIVKEPTIAVYIKAAIDTNPAILRKPLKEQIVILAIDALDEYERDTDIRLIIHLLSKSKTLSSVHLRAFVTSKYQDLVLYEIPRPIIEHDIVAFLHSRFIEIRDDYNALYSAVPLFIFIATDPRQQLARLGTTYCLVLDRLLVGTTVAKRSFVDKFRAIVVPASTDSPVRMFYLSFRDFLLNPNIAKTYKRLAVRLKENVYRLRLLGTRRSEINWNIIDTYLPLYIYNRVYLVVFSQDSKTLASGAMLEEYSNRVFSVVFSHDSKTLASGATLEGYSNVVNLVVFSYDSKTLASGSEDKTIKLWDTTLASESETKTIKL
ncbi:hypothetical protein C8A01DRAFT_50662 [Parachaetomium inaequale]|uniref:Mitochondrial division protein 1 n=1 Tax=Parachaetomium inaequale TaxID=2588326 RepID=A0AAN6PAS1_9PEZI|nr:hypothetical protein C8A01DRAFT_50662 [Parachaetomium inaequale]